MTFEQSTSGAKEGMHEILLFSFPLTLFDLIKRYTTNPITLEDFEGTKQHLTCNNNDFQVHLVDS